MATKPSTEFLAISATDLSPIENRMAVDRLRSLIATNGAYIKSQDGVADEFADENGVESSTTGYLANSIPTMTGTSAPSGTAIFDAESSPTYAAWKAFDNSASTRWARNSAGQVGWVGYDFGSGNGKIISKMVFTAPTSGNGEMPKNFTIDGWNGSAWIVLETITNAAGYSTSETRDYVFTNTTSYQKYRVNVTVSQDGANVTMGGLAMHEYVTALSANTTYHPASDYYHNPPGGTLSVITNVVGAVYSHSSIYASGYTSAFAFNDDLSTRWAASSNNTGWVQIDLGAGNEKTLVKIIMHANGGGDNQCVDGFTFLGSNDGSSFTTLYTMANGQATTEFGTGAGPSLATFNFTNTTAYRYYRVNITQTGTSSSRSLATVYELYGYEAVTTPASMTIVSDTFTAQTAPSEASLVLLHQPISSVTLNTDVLAYISRDGGTTYTQGTLADGGEYSTGINILTINGLDISAQPSGTNMKYKIVTANVKEQRFHGVWLQWS
tara:strand:+ start:101 stop:1588 length:1488 start_codon:yes stop_codon:yes gene_type:complete